MGRQEPSLLLQIHVPKNIFKWRSVDILQLIAIIDSEA